ncbi:hypothetical protein GC197_10650 [bacterium]|nr:hypothetical protein [bacterium]
MSNRFHSLHPSGLLARILFVGLLSLALGCPQPIDLDESNSKLKQDSATEQPNETTSETPPTPTSETPQVSEESKLDSSTDQASSSPSMQEKPTETNPKPEEKQSLKQQIIGVWDPLSLNGKKEHLPDESLEITEQFIFSDGIPATYELDESVEPAHITLSAPDKPSILGLLKLTGDTLKITVADPGSPRPTEINDENGRRLEFRRSDKAPSAKPPMPTESSSGSPDRSQSSVMLGRGGVSVIVTSGAAAFRPDGKIVAAKMIDQVILWDVEKQRQIALLPGDTEGAGLISGISWSSNGKRLAVLREDPETFEGAAYIYDVATMQVATKIDHKCVYLDFSPDGRFFATGSYRNDAQLWSTTTGKEVFTLKSQANRSQRGAISDDSKFFASSPGSDQIEIFATHTGQKVAEVTLPEKLMPQQLLFKPDNKHLLVTVFGNKNALLEVDLATKETSTLLNDIQIDDMVYSKDKTLLVITANHEIKILDAKTLDEVQVIRYVDNSSIDISPDNRYVLSASSEYALIYDRENLNPTSEKHWPPSPTPQQQKWLDKSQEFSSVSLYVQNLIQPHRNFFKDGKPILSWRIRAHQYDDQIKYDEKEPWDAPANAKALASIADGFNLGESDGNKTVIQFVTGPDAAWDEIKGMLPVKDPSTLWLVETSKESAVPWTEPKDFQYDPNDPWKGLPREGFFALTNDKKRGFVSGDTPPEVLNAMFTANGGEEIDFDKWFISTSDYLIDPVKDIKNPMPPFSR